MSTTHDRRRRRDPQGPIPSLMSSHDGADLYLTSIWSGLVWMAAPAERCRDLLRIPVLSGVPDASNEKVQAALWHDDHGRIHSVIVASRVDRPVEILTHELVHGLLAHHRGVPSHGEEFFRAATAVAVRLGIAPPRAYGADYWPQ